jgi:Skp family chaperone for outer membrane proteins
MEIEDLLKDAAEWRPNTEMPEGLERRALNAARRPPLRPMGIMRPRSALFATALAGAACFFMVGRVGQKVPEPVGIPVAVVNTDPTPAPTQEPIKKTLPLKLQTDQQIQQMDRQIKEMPKRLQQLPKRFKQSPKRLQESQKQKQAEEKPQRKTSPRQSPLAQRYPIALDTLSDSVIVGSRVAVDTPVYTPAYYAEPSSDGESTKYTPVKVALDDPDVIYSESQSESQSQQEN